MKVTVLLSRLVMGGIFVLMGLNGFLNFIPMPDKPPEAMAYMQALGESGYFWPFEKGLEIFFGALLLLNRWVVIAIEGLAPIIANIILFHLFLDLSGIIPFAVAVLVCEVILVVAYWKSHIFPQFLA